MHQYLQSNCSLELSHYLSSTPEDPFHSSNTLDCKHCAAAPVTGCLLHTFHEVDKANMASAAVILGILPGTLSLAGSNTAETGLLSLRRPLLAFLLGAGAPAVSPMRTFNYGDPLELLHRRAGSLKAPRMHGVSGVLILVLEYGFALAAVGNLVVLSYQLCVRTICAFAQDTAYLPALWAFLAAAIHISGAMAVAARVKLREVQSGGKRGKRGWKQSIRDEFRLSNAQREATLSIREESLYFLVVSWITSSGIVVHIIFGTLVLSSTLFITTLDAVTVVFQFLGSTIVCRAILMWELSGIRQVVSVREEDRRGTDQIRLMERGSRKTTRDRRKD